MNFEELKVVVGGKLIGDGITPIERFAIDTRTLSGTSKEVFVALRASRDGHDFLNDAIQKGVTHFIIDKKVNLPGNFLIVEDTLEALQLIAKAHRVQFAYPVISITGSNGKTIVKEWLSTILGELYHIIKSPKSYNSQIGVPLSVLEMKEIHELGIFEAGISKSNEMQALEEIIQPELGIFTTLGEAHSNGFESKKHKLSEKLKLFTNCKKLICRKDVPWFETLEANVSGPTLVTWGMLEGVDYKVSKTATGIKVNRHEFKTALSGPSTLENLSHCLVTALEYGVSAEIIQRGLNNIKAVPMRLELKRGIRSCYVIDDTYNNDLIGLRAAIEYMNTYRVKERKTLVLSDFLHTGLEVKDLIGELGVLINSNHIDRVIGIGTDIKSLGDEIEAQFVHFPSTAALIEEIPHFENELILVKGARDYTLEQFVQVIEERIHGTVLEVNFEALRHNLSAYRNLISKNTKMMVMVKANAYGSGILEVADFLQKQNVDYLGVAYVDEAITLRNNGISVPIMIMNPKVSSFSMFEKYGLEGEIYSLSLLDQYLSETKNPPPIHIKIDTGMHRLGFNEEEIPELIAKLKESPHLKVKSIFTHFSSSDDPSEDEYTRRQAAVFDQVFDTLANVLGYRPIKHASNSPGMVRWPEYHYDMVRLGIGLQGFDPTNKLNLRVVSQLKTEISQIQNLKKGDTVGYSRKGKLERDSKIAIIPIGYEDGYSRIFGNGNAQVMIGNQLCPTVGNICMDMTMVDVTEVNCKEGDPVIAFGTDPTIQDLANISNTIPYEILTNVSGRVKRVFVAE